MTTTTTTTKPVEAKGKVVVEDETRAGWPSPAAVQAKGSLYHSTLQSNQDVSQ